MKSILRANWFFIVIFLLLATFQLWGVPKVPFHPDESTQLFMSHEFLVWLKNPRSMVWNEENQEIIDRYNRDIDAPLNKYLLGLGLYISNVKPLPVDWDWSITWDQNRTAGALPDRAQIRTGRITVTLLLILSLVLIYASGKILNGSLNGIIAALMLGSNALILLHDRRSMAESALTFGVCFAIIGILLGDKRPWLTGIAIALAVNAKQSALPLFAVGLFAVCWLPQNELLTKRFWANIGQYLGVFALLTLILNPMMWEDPVGVVIKSYRARQDFLNKQIDVSETLVPEQVMISPIQRSAVMIANLYILPPSFYEVGNYVKETEMSEMEYINIPGHNLFRGVFGGGILLIITLFGMATATLKLSREHPTSRRNIVLLLLGTFLQAIALIIAVPLPYQRYVIPMVPFISLWIGFGLSQIIYKATTQPFPRLGGMKQV